MNISHMKNEIKPESNQLSITKIICNQANRNH
jgi:hypothetical protein